MKRKSKKKIAVTGLSGVIGSILIDDLSDSAEIIDLYHRSKNLEKEKISRHLKLDLLKKNDIEKILYQAEPDVIIHMASITHIDICEADKKHGRKGIVWKTNVEGTREISKFSEKNKVPLIFISTECVFDGKQELYTEKSKKNPINWYGETKSAAEDEILSHVKKATIIRSVVAFHENDNEKTILGKFLKQLQSTKEVKIVADQIFTPTYTYDITKAIHKAVKKNTKGILHVAPKKRLTPYDFGLLVAKRYNLSDRKITKTTLEKLYGKSRASLRLKNASLSGEKTNKILKMVPKNVERILKAPVNRK